MWTRENNKKEGKRVTTTIFLMEVEFSRHFQQSNNLSHVNRALNYGVQFLHFLIQQRLYQQNISRLGDLNERIDCLLACVLFNVAQVQYNSNGKPFTLFVDCIV